MPAILFVTSGQIGDCVLATGLLSHVLEAYAPARLTLVVAPGPASLFRHVPGLERLIVLEKRSYHRHWLDLYRQVAPRRWDLVVDLRGSALAWMLHTRERRIMAKGDPREHRVVQLGRLFGLSPPPRPRIWCSEEDHRAAAAIMQSGPVLALAPAAAWRGKQWPAERFAALAQRLTAPGAVLAGARVAVLGLPRQERQTGPVLAAVSPERRIDLTDGRDLTAVAACLTQARLFIGNDSGLMHIAAAAGAPTLGLYGPTPPITFDPWGEFVATARTDMPHGQLLDMARHGAPFERLMDTLPLDRVEAAAIALALRSAAAFAAR